MISILVIGTGTQGLATINALRTAGYRIVLLYLEKYNYADFSRFIDKKYHYNCEIINDSFLKKIVHIINEEDIKTIIPMGDVVSQFVSKHKAELQKLTQVECPDYEDFMKGYDKNKLLELCEQNGYPHPKTLDLSKYDIETAEDLKSFPYPAMLKPNLTTGGRGMIKIDNYEQLRSLYSSLHEQYGDYHLQQFIKAGGRQLKVQLYINKEKKLIASSIIEKLRWYPVQGGSNCCAVTIRDDKTIDMCHHILVDLNWLGFADFDLIEDPDTYQLLVMEINPRIPACIKSPIAAGLNWAQVIVESAIGKSSQEYKYREGVVLRHLGFDILWFIKSPNRWRSKPSWFKFFGKNVYYQDMSSWTDPLPFWGGTWNNIKKLITGHGK